MWPFQRKKKTARGDLKAVYYYKQDYMVLKTFSKEGKKSMTQVAHDILLIYAGCRYGQYLEKMENLEVKVKFLALMHRRDIERLKIYRDRFGKI